MSLSEKELHDLVDEVQAFIVARIGATDTLYTCVFAVQTPAADGVGYDTQFEGCGNVEDTPRFLREGAGAAESASPVPMLVKH